MKRLVWILPFLFLAASFSVVSASPSKSNQITEKLDNGILLILRKNTESPNEIAARILLSRPRKKGEDFHLPKALSPVLFAGEEHRPTISSLLTSHLLTFAYEGAAKDTEGLEQFFSYCACKLDEKQPPFIPPKLKNSTLCIDEYRLDAYPLLEEIDLLSSLNHWEEATLIVCGDFELEEMRTSLKKTFAPIPRPSSAVLDRNIHLYSFPDENPLTYLVITYSVDSANDVKTRLRSFWKGFFAQHILRSYLSNHLSDPLLTFQPKRPSLLPSRNISLTFQSTKIPPFELLSNIITQISYVKEGAISQKDFDNAKQAAQLLLSNLRNQLNNVPNSHLASYLSDLSLLVEDRYDLTEFLHHSQESIREITFKNFSKELPQLLASQKRSVDLLTSQEKIEKLQLSEIQYLLEEIDNSPQETLYSRQNTPLEGESASVFGIKKQKRMASQLETSDPYSSLAVTEKEKDMIYTIISTMAENNVIALAFKRGELDHLGKKIHHVHPMRFLGTVFSDPYLKKCMYEISESYFKWGGFMDGFGERMDGEANKGNLLPYCSGLCKSIHADPDAVSSYIQRRKWDGLVKFLIEH